MVEILIQYIGKLMGEECKNYLIGLCDPKNETIVIFLYSI